jgi:hypothetical protein
MARGFPVLRDTREFSSGCSMTSHSITALVLNVCSLRVYCTVVIFQALQSWAIFPE